MNILLNFYPVSTGGGQQVASNFLKQVAIQNHGHEWFCIVGRNSELHRLASTYLSHKNILDHPYSYKQRFLIKKKLRDFVIANDIDIIYNYAPVLPIKGIPQVVRSVYSNLYFPEIPFWNSYPALTRLKKRVIDYFRLKGTLKADGLIFENESMLERSVKLFNYPQQSVLYVAPSVSGFDENNSSTAYERLKNIEGLKILYLSSWHLNKNIHILPEVAKILKEKGIVVTFILSLDSTDIDVQQHLRNKLIEFDVVKCFEFIGKVDAIYVHQIVKISDAMILLSKLECFSSNVVEAFYFKKPLIISDEPWAKAACKDAALYVERDSAKSISLQIENLANSRSLCQDLKNKGSDRLETFNTPENKVMKQVKFLEYIYDRYQKES